MMYSNIGLSFRWTLPLNMLSWDFLGKNWGKVQLLDTYSKVNLDKSGHWEEDSKALYNNYHTKVPNYNFC